MGHGVLSWLKIAIHVVLLLPLLCLYGFCSLRLCWRFTDSLVYLLLSYSSLRWCAVVG